MNSVIVPENEFHVFRKDRDGRGEGVCIIVRSKIGFTPIKKSLPVRFNHLEIICVDLISQHDSDLGCRLICVYLPHGFDRDADKSKSLIDAFTFYGKTNLPICICGDFNLPAIDWLRRLYPDNDNYSLLMT